MRLVKVTGPEGKAEQVAQLAFNAGITQVTIQQQTHLHRDQTRETKDVVDIETSTPKAKAFIDALMESTFFDPHQYSINVRQPRSIVSREKPSRLTWPICEPTSDIYEELWQFSQITISFIGRILIAGLLLGYGMIEDNLLFIIAGLLFSPLLPMMLAMAFGALNREWRLAGQGAFALAAGAVLLFAGGAIVAAIMDPPLMHNESAPLLTSLLLSVVIGVAAVLASVDDAGRREMIGLAASSQIAITPVWLGISLVFGHPLTSTTPTQRAITFAVNICAIVITSLVTYAMLRARNRGLRRLGSGATGGSKA